MKKCGPKPRVILLGADANAFRVLALCNKAAQQAGWSAERIAEFQKEAKAGDFDHLIQTCMKHFEVD